jgi:hypothetical protein
MTLRSIDVRNDTVPDICTVFERVVRRGPGDVLADYQSDPISRPDDGLNAG